MSESRRPSDDLGRELTSLWRTAVSSFDDLRDTVLRGGQAGKSALDVTLQKRQRERMLVELGELVLEESRMGAALPASCDGLVARIRELEAQIGESKAAADRAWQKVAPQGADPSAPANGVHTSSANAATNAAHNAAHNDGDEE